MTEVVLGIGSNLDMTSNMLEGPLCSRKLHPTETLEWLYHKMSHLLTLPHDPRDALY